MLAYDSFLHTKSITHTPSGKIVDASSLNDSLYDFQKALVIWALERGRAALFTGTGTGKTRCQLAWSEHIDGRVLILAPLAVAEQTIREAEKMGMESVQYVRRREDMTARICITNYDLLHHFLGVDVQGLVADEASIIKHFDSQTRKTLIDHFRHIPYRLCCTATPAPNAIEEIGNYAEFLDVLTLKEMRATFFVHYADSRQGWQLRGHGKTAFYRWLSSWAMAMRSPEDLGFDGSSFILPPLMIKEHFLQWDGAKLLPDKDGQLSLHGHHKLHGITDRVITRKQTAELRATQTAHLARDADGQVVIWCGLVSEGDAVMKLLRHDDAIEIKGSNNREEKRERLTDFVNGKYKILVTKASIAGFGINMQNAHTAIFLGLNDSWESWYQAVRRLWRYGQAHAVTTHVVMSDHEKPIWDNVQQKEREALTLIDELIASTQSYGTAALHHRQQERYVMTISEHKTERYHAYHGDCVEVLRQIPSNTIHLSTFSPPFSALYVYTATERDLGNSKNEAEFFEHFSYVSDELLRVTLPGRNVAMHVSQVPAMLVHDGWIGMKDFRGDMVRHMVEHGWVYHGEVVIDKDPQVQAVRTKAKGLMFAQKSRDASWLRPALADYILLFRKPGENPVPIIPDDVSNDDWIRWARPIWYGIRETEVLNAAEGREADDTRHICPLQLDVIERCIRLWSNKGERVLSCFAGIGSEGYVAIQQGRYPILIELKDSYYKTLLKNLDRAQVATHQLSLV